MNNRGASSIPRICSLIAVVVVAVPVGIASQGATDLNQLTATNGLPAGCSLATDKPVIGLSRAAGVDTNPWRGNNRSVVASIREVMYGAPRLVDGPPLSGAQLSRFFARLSEGIDEGYVALYTQPGAEDVAVHALTFSNGERLPGRSNTPRHNSSRTVWLERGRTAIVLFGDEGTCSRAIESHLSLLTQ